MRLLVLRHGETDENLQRIMQGSKNTKLNQRGEEQAKDVGKLIREKEKIDAAYSSDLQRASRTAELIINGEVELFQFPELRERFMGPIEGMYYHDAVEKMKRDGNTTLKAYGESEEEMTSRLSKGWDLVQEDAKKKGFNTIVVVSHGSALATLFTHLVDTGKVGFASDTVAQSFKDNPRLSNCCVTIVEDGKFTHFAERWTDSIVRERDLV